METINSDEKIIKVIHRHPIVFVFSILGFIGAIVFPIVFYYFFSGIVNIEGQQFIYFLKILYYLWVLVIWTVMYVSWTDYYLDTWTITDKRIIDINQNGLFSRQVSALHIDKVQDVSVEIKGVLWTLLGIGNVKVQTAGSDDVFVIPDVQSPNKIKELISGAYLKDKENLI
jgi:uncharacterized membrane protein YdbT with pleckstrin-like domain